MLEQVQLGGLEGGPTTAAEAAAENGTTTTTAAAGAGGTDGGEGEEGASPPFGEEKRGSTFSFFSRKVRPRTRNGPKRLVADAKPPETARNALGPARNGSRNGSQRSTWPAGSTRPRHRYGRPAHIRPAHVPTSRPHATRAGVFRRWHGHHPPFSLRNAEEETADGELRRPGLMSRVG